MGDSLFVADRIPDQSAAAAREAALGQEVIDRSVRAARMIYALPLSGAAGLDIQKQYQPEPRGRVALNGGGNDLSMGCCGIPCDRSLDRMAARNQDVTFIFMADLVPHGDRSFHGPDLVQPSPEESSAITARITAQIIGEISGRTAVRRAHGHWRHALTATPPVFPSPSPTAPQRCCFLC